MDSILNSSVEKVLAPPNFKTVKQIDELDNESIKKQVLVNVIGFINDFQVPRPTGGTDYKCTLNIIDLSVKEQGHGMAVNIFWPVDYMPVVAEGNSVVMVRNAKVQMRSGAVSLLANKWTTEVHIIPSSKITKGIIALSADWRVFSVARKGSNPPSPLELAYVNWMVSRLDEMILPSEDEFQTRVAQSGNGRDKFCLLKDAKPECFYDILGQVVKIYDPGNGLGPITVYFSDYTANSNFHNYAWGGGVEDSNSRDGDTYGYIKGVKKDGNEWPGPYGKLTVQLTLWDAHAKCVRESVKPDDWLLLTNIKMGYGKMGGLLEGFLRGDRGAYDGKSQVKIMERSENSESIDPRWKEAVARKQAFLKKFEKQKQQLLAEAQGLSTKRRADDEGAPKKNAKKRRQERRAGLENKVAVSEAKATDGLDLNVHIKCNFQDRSVWPVKDILKPEILLRTEDGHEYESPFTLRKYRANVRVVDYYPHRIEDFAVGRRSSDMDILSDYSGGEDTDHDEEIRIWNSGKGFAKNVWEWRFELLVEDVDPEGDKERLWLTVDNSAAEGLLAIEEDATSLRGNFDLLAKLKEQLFKLWGDLEELKSAQLDLQNSELKPQKVPPSTIDSIISSPIPAKNPGAQPDIDSDVENNEPKFVSAEKTKQTDSMKRDVKSAGKRENREPNTALAPRNKAFTCCIKQYGIKVDEEDSAKATAGDGKRWQRKFGLFDTFIV